MSQFSDEMAQVAIDLITEYGQEADFLRSVNGEYDPTSGEYFTQDTTPYSGMIVPNDYKEREIDGTIIQRGDVKVLAHKMTETPAVGDQVTFGEIDYRIINVKKTKANGADCLYTLQVRV